MNAGKTPELKGHDGRLQTMILMSALFVKVKYIYLFGHEPFWTFLPYRTTCLTILYYKYLGQQPVHGLVS